MDNDREIWEEFLYLLDKYSNTFTNPDGNLKINNIVRYYFENMDHINNYMWKFPRIVEIMCENNINFLADTSEIPANMFWHVSDKIKTFQIPEGIKAIGTTAFMQSGIPNVILPQSLIRIAENAFEESNIESIVIPEGVSYIEEWAFYMCEKLKNVEIKSNELTLIETNTFSKCINLEKIILPDSLLCIDSNAFYGCSKLETIVIPENVTNIYAGAFSHCENLKEIIIPESVNYIGYKVFDYCPKLKITCKGNRKKCESKWDKDWNPKGNPVIWEN